MALVNVKWRFLYYFLLVFLALESWMLCFRWLCMLCLQFVGQESGQEEKDDVGPSSSCSSPDEKSYYEDEWSYSLEVTGECTFDGEVGKRLNQMVPVPVSAALFVRVMTLKNCIKMFSFYLS